MGGRAGAFRWTVALLSVGFIVGAYVDAASRLVTPSALAPWNDVFVFYAASFTYSKSPGLLSMPTRGGAIQDANLSGS